MGERCEVTDRDGRRCTGDADHLSDHYVGSASAAGTRERQVSRVEAADRAARLLGTEEETVETYDNDIAAALDPEAAAAMKAAGCEIRFIRPFEPAYRSRDTGVWSRCVWVGGQPAGTILATSFEQLLTRVAAFDAARAGGALALVAWRAQYQQERFAVIRELDLRTNDADDAWAEVR